MKKIKKIAALMISTLMILCALPMNVSAMVDYSGTCGQNVRWDYDISSHTLTISGNGPMFDYDDMDDVPWEKEGIFNGEGSDKDEDYEEDESPIHIVVKEGVTSIGRLAFSSFFDYPITISLPKSLKSIGDYAFWISVKTFTVPKNVKSIGRGALAGCDIGQFKVAKGNKYFSVKSGVLFNKKKTELIAYPTGRKGKSYSIPNSVKTIKAYTFSGNEAGICGELKLKSITFPAKLKKIEGHAFEWYDGTFRFKGKPPKLGSDVFRGVNAKVTYPKKYKSSWKKWIQIGSWKAEETDMTFKAR